MPPHSQAKTKNLSASPGMSRQQQAASGVPMKLPGLSPRTRESEIKASSGRWGGQRLLGLANSPSPTSMHTEQAVEPVSPMRPEPLKVTKPKPAALERSASLPKQLSSSPRTPVSPKVPAGKSRKKEKKSKKAPVEDADEDAWNFESKVKARKNAEKQAKHNKKKERTKKMREKLNRGITVETEEDIQARRQKQDAGDLDEMYGGAGDSPRKDDSVPNSSGQGSSYGAMTGSPV